MFKTSFVRCFIALAVLQHLGCETVLKNESTNLDSVIENNQSGKDSLSGIVNRKIPTIESKKISLRKGEAKVISFPFFAERDQVKSFLCDEKSGKKNQDFTIKGNKIWTVIVASIDAEESHHQCFFEFELSNSEDIHRVLALDVDVLGRNFRHESLKVDPEKVHFSEETLERIEIERKLLKTAYGKSSKDVLFDKPFIKPVDSIVTSPFGKRRTFNGKLASIHWGTDLRAQKGVPIATSNSGKVLFVGHLFLTGYTVIVDHGLEITTTYSHLSLVKVRPGKLLNQGDIVGLAGDTGRVTGPHLHWGSKIRGEWIDALSLTNP